MSIAWNGPKITRWEQFSRRVRSRGRSLLSELDRWPDSVLVTGCQRSGTTMLSRLITNTPDMTNFWFGKDEELAAALILSGYVDYQSSSRHCFQTTYVNERLAEYFGLEGQQKIIWVLRSPESVVYSMLHNWGRFAFNELFVSVGLPELTYAERLRLGRFGTWGLPPLRRACCAYVGKVKQLEELVSRWGRDRLFVVDYDQLVQRVDESLSAIFSFIDQPYKPEYAQMIHRSSLSKARKLKAEEQEIIRDNCQPIYQQMRLHCTPFSVDEGLHG